MINGFTADDVERARRYHRPLYRALALDVALGLAVAAALALVGGDEDFATHAYAASKGGVVSLTRAMA
ncbi:MAG: SDR family oxidoreductase, partial [Actinomycetota bacterium]|nr:SDR family oxidoreductase [Actinomycetota bacterium]